MDKIVNLAKRRGFTFQSSEIYGGLSSCWDYGPIGVELKRNVKNAWWRDMVQTRDDIVGIDCSILMHPRVWEASGHLAGFTDPLIDCRECKGRFRADHIADAQCPLKPSKAPGQFEKCDLTEARNFNLMFKTFMGPVEESASVVYMRPETAQGIFVNFKNVQTTARTKIPFGIAQIGKSFRNEITPGNFLFRTREFEQMEMEYFVKPGDDDKWFEYWIAARRDWYIALGIRPEKLRLRPHAADELAHYAKGCADVEYEFPIGWSELEGIANRTDFDLKRHAEASGRDLSYFDGEKRERFLPFVISRPPESIGRCSLSGRRHDEDQVEGEPDRCASIRGWRPTRPRCFRSCGRTASQTRKIYDELRRHFPVATIRRARSGVATVTGRDRHASASPSTTTRCAMAPSRCASATR
jgi:glycyl-tRNA synthetase